MIMLQTVDHVGPWRHIHILGGGRVTSDFYLPALRRMGLLKSATVVDPGSAQCADISAGFADVSVRPMAHDVYLEALEPPRGTGREVVIVALPNAFHVDAVERVIAKGHHVLCEKPLALSRQSCSDLVALAHERGVLLKVAMTRRYLPTFMLARDVIRRGELGAVTRIDVKDCGPFSWNPRSFAFFARDSGGMLADMGVHYLDYLDSIVGPMSPVAYEDDSRGGTESSCDYRLLAGTVPIDIKLSRVGYSGHTTDIHCERGVIRIDKANETELTIAPDGGSVRRVSLHHPFDEADWPSSYEGSFCQMMAELGKALDGAPAEIADATDAARAAGLIEWAYARRSPVRAASVAGGVHEARKVLVTGGTGFIGGHLVDRLTRLSDDVRVTVRSPRSCANLSRYAVEMCPTNLLDSASVRAAVEGRSHVFHLAYGQDGKSAPAITIDGTKNVVRAAIEAKVRCVVVLSTMYVFGFPTGPSPVVETFPYRPYGGEYANSKAEMERWCLAEASKSGETRIVVLNPTCVFGPGGGAYSSLPVDLARTGQFCWVNDGSGTVNFTYVQNTVDAILAAVEAPEAHGERFIINDGHTSWRGLLEPFLVPLGVDIPSYTEKELTELPRFGGRFRLRDVVTAAIFAPEVRRVVKRSALLRRAFSVTKSLPSPLEPHAAPNVETSRALPPEWLAELFPTYTTTFSSAKAHRILRWSPRVSLTEAQDETVLWLMKTGRLPQSTGRASTDCRETA